MQTDNLSIAACTDAATTHIDKNTSLLSCFSLLVFAKLEDFLSILLHFSMYKAQWIVSLGLCLYWSRSKDTVPLGSHS